MVNDFHSNHMVFPSAIHIDFSWSSIITVDHTVGHSLRHRSFYIRQLVHSRVHIHNKGGDRHAGKALVFPTTVKYHRNLICRKDTVNAAAALFNVLIFHPPLQIIQRLVQAVILIDQLVQP